MLVNCSTTPIKYEKKQSFTNILLISESTFIYLGIYT